MTPFTLYRFYNAGDELLYVGLSVNPGNRFERHRQDKTWWSEVTRIEMEQLPNHESLKAAEREAIKEEKPLYNVLMNARPDDEKPLIWLCEICRAEIIDGSGYVAVNMRDLFRYRDYQKAFKERGADALPAGFMDAADLLAEYPVRPRWHIIHLACDSDPEADAYAIHVERIRTPSHLLHWSAHLLEKSWIQSTDWDDILHDQAAGGFPW